MSIKYSDLPMLKKFIADRTARIEELEKLDPTPERLAEVRRITREAKDIERSIKALRGKYPYAV